MHGLIKGIQNNRQFWSKLSPLNCWSSSTFRLKVRESWDFPWFFPTFCLKLWGDWPKRIGKSQGKSQFSPILSRNLILMQSWDRGDFLIPTRSCPVPSRCLSGLYPPWDISPMVLVFPIPLILHYDTDLSNTPWQCQNSSGTPYWNRKI